MNYLGDIFNVENARKHTEFMRLKNVLDLPGGNGLINTVGLTGSGGAYGAIIGLWTVGVTRPFYTKLALRRWAYISASSAVLGATFAATTSIAGAYRGKDTPLNYGIGGFSTGAVLGAMCRSYPIGCGVAITLGTTAAFFKLWKIEGWQNGLGKAEY